MISLKASRLLGRSCCAAAIAIACLAAPALADPVLTLPPPTGCYEVGTTSLHLIDPARVDPLAPTPRPREFVVRLWYPTRHDGGPWAAYLTPGIAALSIAFLEAASGDDLPDDLFAFPTHASVGASVAPGHHPVVLFSHGLGVPSAFHTSLHEELASRGYIVVGIDHTFDAPVEFPDGRVEDQKPDLVVDDVLRGVRAADVRFVLDSLNAIASGHNPDAAQRPLPGRLARGLDLTRVAGYGFSLGSPSILIAMSQDSRIDAVAALDGDLAPGAQQRPLLMLGSAEQRRATNPLWAAFYDGWRGPRLHIVLDGAEHADLTDLTLFKGTIDLDAVFSTGPIDGERGILTLRTYLVAWLDREMFHRPSPLLHGESASFPEIDFQP
jgi:predicted dienelactone hydrolase